MSKKIVMEISREVRERPGQSYVDDRKSMPYFTREDFELTQRIKSTMVMQKSNVSNNNIFGMEMAKKDLSLSVIRPQQFTELFARIRIEAFLLIGQTDAGKLMIAEAITSTNPSTKLFSITVEDLLRPSVKAESERILRNVFESAVVARPSVIFIDNIECLALNCSNMENDHVRNLRAIFCEEMSGLRIGVFVICTTNQPLHDSKVLKLFDKFIHVALPNEEERFTMFKHRFTGEHFALFTNEELHELSKKTRGFSGGDIDIVYRKAIIQSFRRQHTSRSVITMKDIWELVWETGWDVKSSFLTFDMFSEDIRAHNGSHLRDRHNFQQLSMEKLAEFLGDCLRKYNWL